MTIEDLLPSYLGHLRESSRSPRTIKDYGRAIRAVDRDLPFGADIASEEELKAWLWRDGLEPASRATYYAALRSFYGWAEEAGVLNFDPSAKIKRPQVPQGLPRVASDAHVRLIVTQAREPYRLWGKLAAYAGMRCIEIHRLHREHITQEALKIYRGKGNKSRQLPTHPVIWAAVKDLPAGPLVHVPDERRVSSDFLLHCRNTLDIRGLSLHRIRGWFATTGYKKTKDIRGMQRSLGHANPSTTAGYISVADDQLQAIIAALPAFDDDGDDD